MYRLRMQSIVYLQMFLVLNGAGLAAAEDNFGSWKRIGESHGSIGYNRDILGMPIREVKAVGMVDAPVEVIKAVIRDARAAKEYMCMYSESYLSNLEGMPDYQGYLLHLQPEGIIFC